MSGSGPKHDGEAEARVSGKKNFYGNAEALIHRDIKPDNRCQGWYGAGIDERPRTTHCERPKNHDGACGPRPSEAMNLAQEQNPVQEHRPNEAPATSPEGAPTHRCCVCKKVNRGDEVAIWGDFATCSIPCGDTRNVCLRCGEDDATPGGMCGVGGTHLLRDQDSDKVTASEPDLAVKWQKCVDRIGVLNIALARAIQFIADNATTPQPALAFVEELDAIAEARWGEEPAQRVDYPLPVVIYCPLCRQQHVDEDEWRTRPHRTHRCVSGPFGKGCGCEWQTAAFPTIGVHSEEIKTDPRSAKADDKPLSET